ncbi:hypothetical protein R3P38DRAFT_2774380 [Favolaschia claudopus]|uniref:Uncharacterized protein n=1 Tax=Favolaschia claudopus TaxID=2862362 RepID=A0AAW0BZ77_9AGAR
MSGLTATSLTRQTTFRAAKAECDVTVTSHSTTFSLVFLRFLDDFASSLPSAASGGSGTKENTGDCLLQLRISSHELDLVHRLAHLQGKIKYLTNIGPMYTLEAHKRSDSLSRPSLRDLHFKQNPQAYWARHELSIISLGITSTSHHPKIFWPSALSQSSNLVAPIQVILLLHCKNPAKTSIEHFYDVWATVITTSVLVAPGPL